MGGLDLRDAIMQRLISQISEIGDRCFDPAAAGAGTEKPYLVIKKGGESEDSAWTGYRRIFEVWPNVSRTNLTALDNLAQSVISALEKQLLTTEDGETFVCLYLGESGSDQVIEEWDLLTRGLRFGVLAIQPVAVTETVTDDPWLVALSDWTLDLFTPDPEEGAEEPPKSEWSVYKNAWPSGWKTPSILLRVINGKVTPISRGLFEVEKTVTGHVLGRTPNEQLAAITQIIEALGSAIKIPLDLEAKKYLTVESPTGAYNTSAASALRNGQITLTLKRITQKPSDEVALMGEIITEGGVT
jgi:hypothetical protein